MDGLLNEYYFHLSCVHPFVVRFMLRDKYNLPEPMSMFDGDFDKLVHAASGLPSTRSIRDCLTDQQKGTAVNIAKLCIKYDVNPSVVDQSVKRVNWYNATDESVYTEIVNICKTVVSMRDNL